MILTYELHAFSQISAWRSTTVIRRPRFTYLIANASPFLELRDTCPSTPTWVASNHDVMTSNRLDMCSCTSFVVAFLGKGYAPQRTSKSTKRSGKRNKTRPFLNFVRDSQVRHPINYAISLTEVIVRGIRDLYELCSKTWL